MSIQKEFVLRYRAEGHVRFQIPVRVCNLDAAKALTDGVYEITGVYRVNLFRNQHKLSIRFIESVCDFNKLAGQLVLLLQTLDEKGALKPKPALKPEHWTDKLDDFKAARWAKEKYQDAKETVEAAKIITRVGLKKPKAFINDPEKATIDFLNDILVIFLIKMHWERITKHWLVMPLKHRYEWMALFYMFFLLVRSRKK